MARWIWVGGALSLASAGCWGITLGSYSGPVVMGRALDVRVPVSLAENESAQELCPSAKVFFGEDAVAVNPVRVIVEPERLPKGATLHVTTTKPLNEPYVRLELVVGCQSPTTRQYTWLADVPEVDPRDKVAAAKLPVSPPIALAVPETSASLPLISQTRIPASQTAGVPRADVRREGGALAGASLSTKVRRTEAKPVASGARLQLDSVDLVASLEQSVPSLRLDWNGTLLPQAEAESPEVAARRALARALWASLNATPDDILAQRTKLASAESDLQQLKTQLAVARQSEADLRGTIQTNEEEFFKHPLVLALSSGLLLALGAIAYLLRVARTTKRSQVPWWKGAPHPSKSNEEAGNAKQRVETSPVSLVPARKRVGVLDRIKTILSSWRQGRVDRKEEDSSLLMPDSLFEGGPVRREIAPPTDRKGPTTFIGSDFPVSQVPSPGHSMATEELFDLQQQVEFFVSLGQAEQAVDVLLAHLADSSEPSPLAYLDLLKLYHDLNRQSEYEALRTDFNRQFGASAPPFERYSYSRRGLERYETALSRIQSLWPTPAVLDVIEASIFRHATTPDESEEMFDLEAYRELLMLYGIARELIEPDSMLGSTFGTASTFGYFEDSTPAPLSDSTLVQPLVADTPETRKRKEAGLPAISPAPFPDEYPSAAVERDESGGVSLDIDLGQLHDFPVKQVAEPVSQLPDRSVAGTNGQEMSFDLTDSVYQPLANALSPQLGAASSKLAKETKHDESMLDFTDLGSLDDYTIRKSGPAS